MTEYDIEPLHSSPTYMVGPNTTFKEAVQHTDIHVGKGNDLKPDAWPHYRYKRYLELLKSLTPSEARKVHVDIGCGAGLFSWVFLDWAMEGNVGLDHVELYGFDHCQAMIKLAEMVRTRLTEKIQNYPALHYYDDVDTLLRELEDNHHEGSNYIITCGHVLAQAHNPSAINNFTRIIVRVRELVDDQSKCVLMAVDAKNWSTAFATGWDLLLSSLDRNRIRYDQQEVRVTAINDDKRAKRALLYPA